VKEVWFRRSAIVDATWDHDRVTPSDLLAVIRATATGAGLDAVGVAGTEPFCQARGVIEARKSAGLHAGMAFTYGRPERSTDPARQLPGARSLVVGARSYWEPTPHRPDGAHGLVAAYARRDHYAELRTGLSAVAGVLEAAGWRTLVLVDDNRLVDRAAAHRAGLGWYGKNTNLLLEGLGSWFVLGSVLTDASLPVAEGQVPDGCGSCDRCQPACPTGALDQAGAVDARRCLAWLLQDDGIFPRRLRVSLGDRLYGCDDCQEACPPNRLRIRRASAGDTGTASPPAAPARSGEGAWVDLVALLASTDEELMERFGRWYVPRRRAEYLRRNALVVLANVADGQDPAVVEAVARALGDQRPVVRAHAVWAARRLGLDHLLAVVAGDDDPWVRTELAEPVPVRQHITP